MKRCFESLTNEELAQILAMRNRKLETWLKQNEWADGGRVNPSKHVYYQKAKLHSVLVMECLIELEARAIPNSEFDKPYLALLVNGV